MRPETNRIAGQPLLRVVVRIRDLEFALLAGIHAAQVLAEARDRVLIADVQHDLVLLDRRPFDAAQAFERNDRIVAVLHRARIHVDVLGLGLADLLDPLVHVFLRDLRLLVHDGHALVVLQFDIGRHLELGFEPERLAGLEMNVGDIRRARHVQPLVLGPLPEMLGDERADHFLADVFGIPPADHLRGSFAGAEAGNPDPLLDIAHNFAGFSRNFVRGNGQFQRTFDGFSHGLNRLAAGRLTRPRRKRKFQRGPRPEGTARNGDAN